MGFYYTIVLLLRHISRPSVLPSFNKPLPQSDGPKLHPFPNRETTISFVCSLSEVKFEGHAHVFEVTIGSKENVLKMVCI